MEIQRTLLYSFKNADGARSPVKEYWDGYLRCVYITLLEIIWHQRNFSRCLWGYKVGNFVVFIKLGRPSDMKNWSYPQLFIQQVFVMITSVIK